MHLLIELFVVLFIEALPGIFRRLGALIRWTYLRKDHSYGQVLKMDGNLGVGLSVFVPILAVYILYLAAN